MFLLISNQAKGLIFGKYKYFWILGILNIFALLIFKASLGFVPKILVLIVSTLILSVLQLYRMYLDLIISRDEFLEVPDVEDTLDNLLNYIVLDVLFWASIVGIYLLGVLVFSLGLFVHIRLITVTGVGIATLGVFAFSVIASQSKYLCLDKGYSPIRCLSESANILKGNYSNYLILIFSQIVRTLLGVFTFGVYWIWLFPRIRIERALFYNRLLDDSLKTQELDELEMEQYRCFSVDIENNQMYKSDKE